MLAAQPRVIQFQSRIERVFKSMQSRKYQEFIIESIHIYRLSSEDTEINMDGHEQHESTWNEKRNCWAKTAFLLLVRCEWMCLCFCGFVFSSSSCCTVTEMKSEDLCASETILLSRLFTARYRSNWINSFEWLMSVKFHLKVLSIQPNHFHLLCVRVVI